MSRAAPSRWVAWVPWVALGSFAALWIARWPLLPLVLDPYYHLLIARQFQEAAGVILHETWEFAPQGRPHLYPPLLHVLLAFGLRAGFDPLTIIRLASVALPPLLLLSVFLVARRLWESAVASCTVLVALLPYTFHLHSAITLAATLGMIELLWLIDAVEHDRPISAGLWLGLSCFTHLGLPWVSAASMAVYGVLEPAKRRTLLRAAWGLLLGSPWLIHVLRYRATLSIQPRIENTLLDLTPAVYAFALLGLWRCWRMRGSSSWAAACWVGFGLLAWAHRYRWLSGEGMLPAILLAGMGIHHVAQRGRREVFASLAIAGAIAMSPSLVQSSAGWRWVWRDTAPWHLLGMASRNKETDVSLYEPMLNDIVQTVKRESGSNEILWSNADYAVGLVAALAGRPMAGGMLNEVRPPQPVSPVDVARLLVWFKFTPAEELPAQRLQEPRRLRRLADTALAQVFRYDGPRPIARRPQAAVPLGLAGALLGAALAALAWDGMRSRQRVSRSV